MPSIGLCSIEFDWFGNRTHTNSAVRFRSIAELNRTQSTDWVRLSSISERSICYAGYILISNSARLYLSDNSLRSRNETKCFLAPVLYSDHHESEYCFDWCRSNAVSELMLRGKSLQYSFYNAGISSHADEFGISEDHVTDMTLICMGHAVKLLTKYDALVFCC